MWPRLYFLLPKKQTCSINKSKCLFCALCCIETFVHKSICFVTPVTATPFMHPAWPIIRPKFKRFAKMDQMEKLWAFWVIKHKNIPWARVKIHRQINKLHMAELPGSSAHDAPHTSPLASVLHRLTPLSAQLSNNALSYLLDIYDG